MSETRQVTTRIPVTVDLDAGVCHPRKLHRTLIYGNADAHEFLLECLRNGVAEELVNTTVTLYCTRADGKTVTVAGKTEGNIARVKLSDECYAVEGPVTISVELAVFEARATHAVWLGMVRKTQTEEIVAGGVVPSVGELLEQLQGLDEIVHVTLSEDGLTASHNASELAGLAEAHKQPLLIKGDLVLPYCGKDAEGNAIFRQTVLEGDDIVVDEVLIGPDGTATYAQTVKTLKMMFNLEDGAATGSVRHIGSAEEGAVMSDGETSYHIGPNAYAMGIDAKAAGTGSVAFGLSNEVTGDRALAAGQTNTVGGENSFAAGSENIVSGKDSGAIGSKLNVAGNTAFAAGFNSQAKGSYAVALGMNNTAGDAGAVAIGAFNKANAQMTAAIGAVNEVTAQNAAAIGARNKVSGTGAFAAATANEVSGQSAAAIGNGNVVSGTGASAIGSGNTVTGDYAHAFGEWTVANGSHQLVFGRQNIADPEGKYLMIAGNSPVGEPSGDEYRSNAMTLDWQGNLEIQGELRAKGGIGASLPSGSAPNRMLATNNDGETVWMEQLAYRRPGAVVLPETTYTVTPDGAPINQPFVTPIQEGDRLIVRYNGGEYPCEAIAIPDSLPGMLAFGNLAALGGEGGNPDAPFGIIAWPEMLDENGDGIDEQGTIIPMEDVTDITVSISKAGGVKKIDPEFLPKQETELVVTVPVTLVGDSVNFGTADKRWADVEEADKSGKHIRIKLVYAHLNATMYGEIRVAFMTDKGLGFAFEFYTSQYLIEGKRHVHFMHRGENGEIAFSLPD